MIAHCCCFLIDIREDLDCEELKKMINEFSRSDSMYGPNLLTLTCADPATYGQSVDATDSCDLLRVRQGGWSEHFCVLWDAHKNQHMRRPFFDLDANIDAVRHLYQQTTEPNESHKSNKSNKRITSSTRKQFLSLTKRK